MLTFILFRCERCEGNNSRPRIDIHIFRPIWRFRRWLEQRTATIGASART